MLRDDIQKEFHEKISKIDEEKHKAVKESAALAKEKSTVQHLKQELEVSTSTNCQAILIHSSAYGEKFYIRKYVLENEGRASGPVRRSS